jgi:hypothetical protein
MKILSWPFGALSTVALAIALFAVPTQFEGAVLISISPGHALSVLDSFTLLPLLIGSAWLFGGLRRRREHLYDWIRLSPSVSTVAVFIAGAGLGLLLASSFSSFFWWWAIGAALFGAMVIAAVIVVIRR